ncbi:Cell division control protein 18 [Zancudomyces culisetae]|uniref:Cell division control protein n=1 Tax=Zancudomyces culisetae TaxID=1213189 RepID=A0A1R1PKC3_ZANCU|nr:Cell division control protein 18 [Zancudomyces culisetae]|eukprot:OMH81332.1 Cell division control protein 18 [Zancudomyces culisetae]
MEAVLKRKRIEEGTGTDSRLNQKLGGNEKEAATNVTSKELKGSKSMGYINEALKRNVNTPSEESMRELRKLIEGSSQKDNKIGYNNGGTTLLPKDKDSFLSPISTSNYTKGGCTAVQNKHVEYSHRYSTRSRSLKNRSAVSVQNLKELTVLNDKAQVTMSEKKTRVKASNLVNEVSPIRKKQELEKTSTAFGKGGAEFEVIGREDERKKILEMVTLSMEEMKGGSLYISGNPGTGKTASVMSTINGLSGKGKANIAVVNCMSIQTPKQVFLKIYEGLATSQNLNYYSLSRSKKGMKQSIGKKLIKWNNLENTTESDLKAKLEDMFIGNSRDFLNIVVLDELDNIVTRTPTEVYLLFEWAMRHDSNLLLIGIANSLDLTDRLLPRLQTRNCVPDLLHFTPYTVEEIVVVLKNRVELLYKDSREEGPDKNTTPKSSIGVDSSREILRDLIKEPTSVCESGELPQPDITIQQSALELCARKVASGSGDMRKALDACKLAIDGFKQELKRKSLLNDGKKTPRQVTVVHMMKALSNLYGTSTDNVLLGLNFQQKIVLASIINFQKNVKSQLGIRNNTLTKSRSYGGNLSIATSLSATCTLSLNYLYELYSRTCHEINLPSPLMRTEFNDLVSLLESIGVVTIEQASAKTSRRISIAKSFMNMSMAGSLVSNGNNTIKLAMSSDGIAKVISNTPLLSAVLL